MTELMRRRRALMEQSSGFEHGTWEDLVYHVATGDYSTAYSIGEILPLDLGTEGIVNAQIVAFDVDEKTNGGKAPVTLITEHLLNSSRRFNPALIGTAGNYTEGTGTIGGWAKCELRSWIYESILPLFPQKIREKLVTVNKYTRICDTAGAFVQNDRTEDTIWIPSRFELTQFTGDGVSAITYPFFSSISNRKKGKPNASTVYYRLRTANSSSETQMISSGGQGDSVAVTSLYGFCVGFCL